MTQRQVQTRAAGHQLLDTLAAADIPTIPSSQVSGLGSLATQSGTFSGTSSGTNTGDQTLDLSDFDAPASIDLQAAGDLNNDGALLVLSEGGFGGYGQLKGGDSASGNIGAHVVVAAGSDDSQSGGDVSLVGGNGVAGSTGGLFLVRGGTGNGGTSDAASLTLHGGASSGFTVGNADLTAGTLAIAAAAATLNGDAIATEPYADAAQAAAIAASQPVDATLTALAGLATGANKLPYSTGTDAFAQADFSAAGRALVDDADASAQRTTLGLGTLATQSLSRVSRASNTILAGSDAGKEFDASAAFTQTLTAAATLGAGWWAIVKNATTDGTSLVVIDPNSSETIDGLATITMYSGETRLITCDGSNFVSTLLKGGFARFTGSPGAFIVPPGINEVRLDMVGAGGQGGGGAGGAAATVRQGGTGGGGGHRHQRIIAALALGAAGTSITVTPGAGGSAAGAGGSSGNGSNGTGGANATFGTLVTAFGGGGGGLGSTVTTRSGGSGGGSGEAGITGSTATNRGGGAVSTSSGGEGESGAAATVAVAGAAAQWGGGSGGGQVAAAGVGLAGGTSVYGGGGGASGGGLTTANAAVAGGAGGNVAVYGPSGGGGTAGTSGAGAGQPGTDGNYLVAGKGGGGGGTGVAVTGGVGGAGGAPGGGGGGGGGGTTVGGAGGVGGAGEIRVFYS